jgi:hypothetical protein
MEFIRCRRRPLNQAGNLRRENCNLYFGFSLLSIATRESRWAISVVALSALAACGSAVGVSQSGSGTTLAWSTTSADACVASGGWSGPKPPSGSVAIDQLTTTTSYQLTCTGSAGSSSQSAEVVGATPAPTVSLTALPTTVAAGGTTTLTWSSTDATTCTASGGWGGLLATSGSLTVGALASNTEFVLTCSGIDGTASQATTVTVASATPVISFSAAPSSVTAGNASTLTWASSNAATCTASGAWTGNEALSGAQATSSLEANTTYTLTCTGAGGSATQSALVSVTPAVPTVSFGASPSTVTKGSRATLSWSSSNASTCAASGAWAGTKALSGTQSTGSISANGTYTLTCTGAGGKAAQSTTVTVAASAAAPTVSLSVGPSAITSGASSTLTWSSTNATTCTASGAWSGTKAINGSQSTGGLTASAIYTLACTGTGGSASQSATVSVTPAVTDDCFEREPEHRYHRW